MTELSFSQQVYQVVRRIPRGKVATYGQVASLTDHPRNARFVGYALHDNPEPGVIPCHRVVFRDGSLAPGFAFGGPERQRQLLEDEGVHFVPPVVTSRLVQMAGWWIWTAAAGRPDSSGAQLRRIRPSG
ncbi:MULTISPECIES: MGMT family protein [unclassified Bifidobacterium]|uniref:MGMT family protein n=1 Tax=unclassified Bifidobacterium TaxID=2608897 RepID=UPI00226B5B62|nr:MULTISPECIES: MGMT family protein [unclassified Bifidobacterium]